MQKIELEISGLSHTITQSQSYAVLLSEVNGLRKLPIVIGAFEAQAIAVAIEKGQQADQGKGAGDRCGLACDAHDRAEGQSPKDRHRDVIGHRAVEYQPLGLAIFWHHTDAGTERLPCRFDH